MRALWLVATLALPVLSHAELVRGSLKVDVRDASGAPVEAVVTARPESGPGEPLQLARVGDVYVAEGLLDGVWRVEVAGAATERVRVRPHLATGVVAIVGSRKKSSFTVGADEPACAVDGGVVVEAVAFAGDRLGAGRLEVSKGKKRLCSSTIAGGGATLRLLPGEYAIVARFVGGRSVKISYRLREGAPPPLVLRAR